MRVSVPKVMAVAVYFISCASQADVCVVVVPFHRWSIYWAIWWVEWGGSTERKFRLKVVSSISFNTKSELVL